MSRIKTEEFLDRIEKSQFRAVILRGLQNGDFCMLLETEDGTFLHENNDGSWKCYPNAENALIWLKRKARINKVEIDIGLWKTQRN